MDLSLPLTTISPSLLTFTHVISKWVLLHTALCFHRYQHTPHSPTTMGILVMARIFFLPFLSSFPHTPSNFPFSFSIKNYCFDLCVCVCIYACTHVCVGVQVHLCHGIYVEVMGKLSGISSFLPCGRVSCYFSHFVLQTGCVGKLPSNFIH